MNGIKVYVYTDTEDGGSMAHVPALPGVVARGATRDEALRRVRAVLADEIAYLQQCQFRVPMLEGTTLTQAQPIAPNLFPEDLIVLERAELTPLVQRLTLSRQRILNMARALPTDQRTHTPPGAWSIDLVLEHIANGELSLLGHLFRWPADGREDVRLAHQLLLQRLQELEPSARAQVSMNYGLDWTPRKVIRRATELLSAWNVALEQGSATPAGIPGDNATQPTDLQPLDDTTWRASLDTLAREGATLNEHLATSPTSKQDLKHLAGILWALKALLTAWPNDVIERLHATRQVVMQHLARAQDRDLLMSQTDLDGELWTVRKVIRRVLEHEREHYDHIQELLGREL